MRRDLGIGNRRRGLLWIVTVLSAILLIPLAQVSAEPIQDDSGWSKTTVLFDQPGVIDSPTIVADRTGRLHVFWHLVHEFSRNEAIYYQRSEPILSDRSAASPRWSAPVLLQLRKQLGPPSAVVDDAGEIHLVFQAADKGIWYTRASVGQATDQGSWSTPVQVGVGQAGAQIALGPGSRLYLVYGGITARGVVLKTSPDSGNSWSAAQLISLAYSQADRVDDVRIAVESERALHVAWSEFTSSTHRPTGVYYTRSMDGGKDWSETFQLAGSGYTQANLAYSAATGELHAAWNGSGNVKGRYYRRSADAGYLWHDVENISPAGTGGGEGFPQMAVDANGVLSLLTTEAGCAWYLERQNAWTSPFCFNEAATIAQPGLALLNGRRLAAVFQEENQSFYRLDFSLHLISAPEIAPRPFEQSLAALAPSETPLPAPTSTSTALPREAPSATPTTAPPTRAAPTLAASPHALGQGATPTAPAASLSPFATATATPKLPEGTPAQTALSLVGAAQLTPSVQAAEASADHLVETRTIPNTGNIRDQPMDTSQIILISLSPTLLGLVILIASRILRRNRPDY